MGKKVQIKKGCRKNLIPVLLLCTLFLSVCSDGVEVIEVERISISQEKKTDKVQETDINGMIEEVSEHSFQIGELLLEDMGETYNESPGSETDLKKGRTVKITGVRNGDSCEAKEVLIYDFGNN